MKYFNFYLDINMKLYYIYELNISEYWDFTAYGFRPDSGRICMMCVIVGWSRTEYMSSLDHRGRARRPGTE